MSVARRAPLTPRHTQGVRYSHSNPGLPHLPDLRQRLPRIQFATEPLIDTRAVRIDRVRRGEEEVDDIEFALACAAPALANDLNAITPAFRAKVQPDGVLLAVIEASTAKSSQWRILKLTTLP